MLSIVARRLCRAPASNTLKPSKWCFTNGNPSAQSCRSNFSSLWSRTNSLRSSKVQTIRKMTTDAANGIKEEVASTGPNKTVGWWLVGCSGIVFGTVVLDGLRHHTDTGLSTSTWRLFSQKLPQSNREWLEEYKHFQELPEYKLTDRNVTFSQFQNVWYLEYANRLWSRVLPLGFILPTAYFWMRGKLPAPLKKRVLIAGGLIALHAQVRQNMLGSRWKDRSSHSRDSPRKPQFCFAMNLGLSLFLYSFMLRTALDCIIPLEALSASAIGDLTALRKARSFFRLSRACTGLVVLTALSGAFVSGLGAGRVYNSFPKMGEKWIPDDILDRSPIIKNFFDNPTTVQFNHRVLGAASLALISTVWLLSRRTKLPPRAYTVTTAFAAAAWFQVISGIASLLNHVPIPLTVTHQSGSFILLSFAIWLSHEAKYLKYLPK